LKQSQDQGISWFNSNKRTLNEINSKKPYEYQRLLIDKRLGMKKNIFKICNLISGNFLLISNQQGSE